MMIEIHGLRVLRSQMKPQPAGTSVVVTDYGQMVQLNLDESSYPALLTPCEARWVAQQLCDAAARAETQQPE